ncbi:peptidase M75, partial [Streptomyces sp. NPDC005828]
MSASSRRLLVGAGTAIAAVVSLAGCAQKTDAKSEDGAITVVAKDDSCEVSKKEFPAGHVKLAVENRG